jgi:hypothetical protein
MKKTLSLLTIALLCCGLTVLGSQKLKPKEVEYLEKAMDAKLQFKLPADKANKAWKRIETFIKKFSSMKITILNDTVIETLAPTRGMMRYGYRATQTPSSEDMEFAVACSYGNAYSSEQANKNAHLLAYYAQTGELIAKLVDK